MKKFDNLNYYELLEIPVNASGSDIRQAYRDATIIYNEESLITYSFFTDEERTEILKKLEDAFHTLIDEKARGLYNKTLVNSGAIKSSVLEKKYNKKAMPLFASSKLIDEEAFLKRIRKRRKEKEVEEISGQILSKEVISGHEIKMLRESMGIELEEIFEVARISVATLKAIEDDNFAGLPPSVYLKNFLKTYADLLQLDQEKVVDGFLRHIELSREAT